MPHPIETAVFLTSIQLLYAYLALYLSLQLIRGLMKMAKTLKRRHVVKCAQSEPTLYFGKLSDDEKALGVTTDAGDAHGFADADSAAMASKYLNKTHAQFAWVPDFV